MTEYHQPDPTSEEGRQAPTRITKQRAKALCEIIGVGISTQMSAIEQQFFVRFEEDGSLTIDSEGYILLSDTDSLDDLTDSLKHLKDAMIAFSIFRKRYA